MTAKYIWDRKADSVRRCDDLFAWASWFETADLTLAVDDLCGCRVSTVFLGLDHNFSGKGDPLLWETMVFSGPSHGEGDRYRTKEEALAGHAAMVARCREAAKVPPGPCEDGGADE